MGRPRKDKNDPHADTPLEKAQEHWDRMNEADERAPDRRPATPVNILTDPIETAEDNRKPAPDVGKALNQMAGRAAITENHDPNPGAAAAAQRSRVINPAGEMQPVDDGEEIQLMRGYQPAEGQKRLRGEVLKLPKKEARRLINIGAAKYTETD